MEDDYDSGPFCKHWGDPGDCDACKDEENPMKLVSLNEVIRMYSKHMGEDPDLDIRMACDELLALYDHAAGLSESTGPDAARKVFVQGLTEAASYASWEADTDLNTEDNRRSE